MQEIPILFGGWTCSNHSNFDVHHCTRFLILAKWERHGKESDLGLPPWQQHMATFAGQVLRHLEDWSWRITN
jgi:hypothetical protein